MVRGPAHSRAGVLRGRARWPAVTVLPVVSKLGGRPNKTAPCPEKTKLARRERRAPARLAARVRERAGQARRRTPWSRCCRTGGTIAVTRIIETLLTRSSCLRVPQTIQNPSRPRRMRAPEQTARGRPGRRAGRPAGGAGHGGAAQVFARSDLAGRFGRVP